MTRSAVPDPSSTRPWGEAETPYEAMGGDVVVRQLADAFYDIIEQESPVLHAMLPRDTSGSRQKLYEFLSGWTGGPALYWEKHGHPRLRMRHVRFPIDQAAADEWSRCMTQAVESLSIGDQVTSFLTEQLGIAAQSLLNR